ncbi:MAG: protein-export chaperone SecB [Clostridia bacterium]|nr:protein-export chaperone SecB [Clostridia bacterium]
MPNVNMQAYKVSEIVFNNKVNGKVQLKLSNKISHNVKYSSNGTCEAVMTVEAFDKEHKDVLYCKVTVNGVFTFTGETEKEFIHVETFKELFPFAKATVTTVSANAGVPPIIIKNIDIEKQEIYRFEMNNRDE